LEKRERRGPHSIIVEHGVLMEYERKTLGFLEKLCFHS